MLPYSLNRWVLSTGIGWDFAPEYAIMVKCKKLIILGMVFSLVVCSGDLLAKERKKYELKVNK